MLAPGEPNHVWTDILSDVKEIYFKVDFLGSPDISEKWHWDNICLVESEDCGCMKISEPEIVACEPLDDGTWMFIYNFYVTNLSGTTTNSILCFTCTLSLHSYDYYCRMLESAGRRQATSHGTEHAPTSSCCPKLKGHLRTL